MFFLIMNQIGGNVHRNKTIIIENSCLIGRQMQFLKKIMDTTSCRDDIFYAMIFCLNNRLRNDTMSFG